MKAVDIKTTLDLDGGGFSVTEFVAKLFERVGKSGIGFASLYVPRFDTCLSHPVALSHYLIVAERPREGKGEGLKEALVII